MTLRVVPAGAITAGVHHTFRDATLADVAASVSAVGEAGHAEFEFDMAFSTTGSRVTNVELTMRLRIDMPEWTAVGTRPQAEQDEWSRFLRALRDHEDGHIAIFRAEAPVTYRRVTAASPRRINAVLNAERARIQRLSNAYDHRTGHGQRQQSAHGTTIIQVPP